MCTFILYLLVRCQLLTLQVWNDSKCCIYKQEKYHSFHATIVINCFLAAHPWCQICRSLRWKTSKKHPPTSRCWMLKRWRCMHLKYTHKCVYIYIFILHTYVYIQVCIYNIICRYLYVPCLCSWHIWYVTLFKVLLRRRRPPPAQGAALPHPPTGPRKGDWDGASGLAEEWQPRMQHKTTNTINTKYVCIKSDPCVYWKIEFRPWLQLKSSN